MNNTSYAAPKKRFDKKTLVLLTMVAPGAIWLFLLRYLPIFGIVLAFQDYKLFKNTSKLPALINNILKSPFVGFKNFRFLFSSPDTGSVMKNTIGYNALWIVLTLVISIVFAIMLNELTKKIFARTYQTLMFFPFFLSWMVASYFLLAFLDPTRGLIANLQRSWSMTPTSWYTNPGPWPFILTGANLWKNIGYSTILYLAAITGIPESQYEAAAIDGAGKFQQIFAVTIPHLKGMIIVLFIMSVGRIMNADFGLFYAVPMNTGSLYPATRVIDTYVYNAFNSTGNMGMTTAAGLFQNLIGFILIMTTNTIIRKVDPDSSLF